MAAPTAESILRFEAVSVRFGGTAALDNLSFDVKKGETRILFGAAGSGKTVLLKTALGLIRPDAGRVFVFGQDVTHLKESDWFDVRARMGVLFQEGGLFDSLTIEDNVAYPILNQRQNRDPGNWQERVRETLRFVELEHTLTKFPSELSGGMRRRVGIARATATEAPLLLYDSPTAGLDPITANTIIALIAKERDTRGTTALLATHRYQDGEIMARYRYDKEKQGLEPALPGANTRTVFMVFNEGKLVFQGTQQELEASKDKYVSRFVRHER